MNWVIIVNYKTADLVADCLQSLAEQPGWPGAWHVVIVDNASGDASLDRLATSIERAGWCDWAQLLAQDRNGGFSYGNNAGIRFAMSAPEQPEYLLLLNPDTVVRPGALDALVNFMACHSDAGIAGSRLENADGGVECSAHHFPSPLGELEGGARLGVLSRLISRHVVTPPVRDEPHMCDWVSGASLVLRRQVAEEVGLLDEGYFLYFEEVDYCHRASNAGWQCWYVPDSVVMHLEGAATGIQSVIRRRPSYWYDSRRRYFLKHYGMSGWILADALWIMGRVSYLLRRFLKLGAQEENRDPKWFMSDLLWGDLRALISGAAWRVSRAWPQL